MAQIESLNWFKSQFKSQPQLGFAHHCLTLHETFSYNVQKLHHQQHITLQTSARHHSRENTL